MRTYRKQPSSKRPILIIAMQVLVRAQKSFLRGIFGGFRLA
jgi:hypothetical protein